MRASSRILLAVALTALPLVAPAAQARPDSTVADSVAPPRDSVEADDRNAPAVVVFRNEADVSADLFLIDGSGFSRRIGWAAGFSTTRIRLPAAWLRTSGAPRLVARPLASNARPSSGPVTLLPGDRLDVRLDAQRRALWVLPSR